MNWQEVLVIVLQTAMTVVVWLAGFSFGYRAAARLHRSMKGEE